MVLATLSTASAPPQTLGMPQRHKHNHQQKMTSQPTASMVLATFSRLLALSAESRLFTMPAMLLLITCTKQSRLGCVGVASALSGRQSS